LFTILSTNTLMEAIEILVDNRLHRLYVIDSDGRPTGIVTLTDIIGLAAE
jgi:CBS domain-containing protein